MRQQSRTLAWVSPLATAVTRCSVEAVDSPERAPSVPCSPCSLGGSSCGPAASCAVSSSFTIVLDHFYTSLLGSRTTSQGKPGEGTAKVVSLLNQSEASQGSCVVARWARPPPGMPAAHIGVLACSLLLTQPLHEKQQMLARIPESLPPPQDTRVQLLAGPGCCCHLGCTQAEAISLLPSLAFCFQTCK